jgi:hypothetical protein
MLTRWTRNKTHSFSPDRCPLRKRIDTGLTWDKSVKMEKIQNMGDFLNFSSPVFAQIGLSDRASGSFGLKKYCTA